MKTAKQQAGQRGGLATVQKHGSEYMREIGKKGAAVTWQRYELKPIDLNDFAMVDRRTGKIKAFLSGRPW